MIKTGSEYCEKIKWLNDRTKEYDEGNPTVTDKEWDDVYFEVMQFEKEYPIHPDSPTQKISYQIVNELKKVKHNHPMLSLAKTKNIEEIKSFVGDKDCILMAKMDGLTCSLTYEDGRLVRAETRGNGEVGEDITHNALVISSIPKRIDTSYHTIVVDGEIICTYNNFEQFKNEYKNPRNFASGSIRLLNSKECENRKLTFVAWDTSTPKKLRLSENLNTLQKLGFVLVPYLTNYTRLRVGLNDMLSIEQIIDNVKTMAQDYSYPIDGIVVKYDHIDEYNAAGRTDHHFKGGLAYKFYDEEYETRLLGIQYTMGRTGVLTPVAKFEPIKIDGSIIERCSLFNLSVLKEKLGKPYVGQKIWICKRNMIIPYIERAEKI